MYEVYNVDVLCFFYVRCYMKLYVDNVVLEYNFCGKKVNCKDNFNCYVKLCKKKMECFCVEFCLLIRWMNIFKWEKEDFKLDYGEMEFYFGKKVEELIINWKKCMKVIYLLY